MFLNGNYAIKTQIKIIDFGIAGLINSETIKAGSIDYSPPEIVGGWNYETNNSNSFQTFDIITIVNRVFLLINVIVLNFYRIDII